LLDELSWRGMVYQHTDGLADALATGEISAYVGFDPTSSSLHIGNLVPVMGLAHLQRAGHKPVALVGGGTGLVGDPSGKATERQLLSEEEIESNARSIEKQLSRFLDSLSTARVADYTIDRSLGYRELVNDFLRQKQAASGGKPHVGATIHRNFDRVPYLWDAAGSTAL